MKGLTHVLFKAAFLLLLFFVGSCKKPIKDKADLIAYINNPENGLKKTEEVGKIKAELIYKPWQLMVVNMKISKVQTGVYSAAKLKDKYFFVLRLSANNKELLRQLPLSDYSEMVQVFAFRMLPFIDAVPDNGKPVDPQDCIFQQTYGMSDANQLLIAFDKARLEKADQLRIRIREFGLNTGNLSFKINTTDINKTENIRLN